MLPEEATLDDFKAILKPIFERLALISETLCLLAKDEVHFGEQIPESMREPMAAMCVDTAAQGMFLSSMLYGVENCAKWINSAPLLEHTLDMMDQHMPETNGKVAERLEWELTRPGLTDDERTKLERGLAMTRKRQAKMQGEQAQADLTAEEIASGTFDLDSDAAMAEALKVLGISADTADIIAD